MVEADDLIHLLSGVTKYETYYMALCPYLHHGRLEENASLLIGQDGWFKCLSCGETGKHDKLFKRIYTGKFAGNQDTTDKYHGFTPTLASTPKAFTEFILRSRNNLNEIPDIQNYWKIRGLSNKAIRSFNLGSSQGAWATIPMYDRSMDKPIRISLRAYHSTLLENGIRYWNSPGAPILFSPDWRLVESQSKVAVCYGLIDALAIASLGYGCVTPSSGKDSLKPQWLKQLGAKTFYFIPDQGEERTAIKHMQKLGTRVNLIQMPYLEHGFSDPADYFQAGKQEKLHGILRRYLHEEEESKNNLYAL